MALRMERSTWVPLQPENRAHRRIQHLRNGLVGILQHHGDGFPEVGIAPELGGNAEGQQQIGHLGLRVGRRHQRRADLTAQVANPVAWAGMSQGLRIM